MASGRGRWALAWLAWGLAAAATRAQEDDGERWADGFGPDHYDDGHHQPAFDHQAILGSKKVMEAFERLTVENSKRKLAELVTLMDKNGDGSVGKEELAAWVLKSFEVLDVEEAEERFGEADANKDGKVTWQEYVADTYGVSAADNLGDPMNYDGDQKTFREDREIFLASDVDGDGVLNETEHLAFAHPEAHAHTLHVLYRRTMDEKDADRDGRLDFREFVGTEGKDRDKEWLIGEKDRFDNDLDGDGDGTLDETETLRWLSPNRRETAEEEASHLIETSDDDLNKVLSLDEILRHHDTFVGSEITDYGHHLENTHKFKDEL